MLPIAAAITTLLVSLSAPGAVSTPATTTAPTVTAGQSSAQAAEHTPAQVDDRHRRVMEAIRVLESGEVQRTPSKRAAAELVGFRDVPASLAGVPTLSLRVRREFRGGGEAVVTNETVLRSPGAMFVRADEGDVEWLFTPNPADGRRAQGYMVDFGRRIILEHDEMDLRSIRAGRDWLDVVTLGFDPDVRGAFTADGQTEDLGGYRFEHLVRERDGVRTEVWWSQELLMPLRIRVARGDASWTQELTEITPVEGTPAEFTPPPQTRLGRMFKTQLLEDWYESHLGCGCGPAGMNLLIQRMRRPGA